jgi:hypothetical protein
MSFGYSTKDWTGTYAALRFIYQDHEPVWSQINRAAWSQLKRSDIPSEGLDYLQAVLGLSEE